MAASASWRDDLMHGNGNPGVAEATQMHDEVRQRAYRRAVGHSGRVRLARIALPILAAVALAGMALFMGWSRMAPEVAIDLSSSTIRDGKLVMANPKLDGFTADERPYSVRAARAVQDLTGSGVIDLERIRAVMPIEANVEAHVSAASGIFDSEANTLDIMQSLSVETTDGKRADLGSAAIDLAAGSLTTDDPVRISMPGAVLEANRLRVMDNGKRLLFESRVRLVVQPDAFESMVSDGDTPADSGG